VVEILSSQVGVSVGGKNLKETILNRQDRDIKSTTTEIVDKDGTFTFLLVQTIGDSGSGGLVDDTENVQTGDNTSILGGLALSVIEVGGDSDDGVGDLLGEESLSDLLHLAQNHGRDFLWSEGLGLTPDLDLDDGGSGLGLDLEGEVLDIVLDILVIETTTDQTLGVEDGVGGVGGVLVLGGISDKTLVLGKGDVRRCNTVTLVVGDDFNTSVLVHTDTRVSGSKIYPSPRIRGRKWCG